MAAEKISIEAEGSSQVLGGTWVAANHPGASGGKYLDFGGDKSSASWKVTASFDGNYTCGIRFSNGDAKPRPLTVLVNDKIVGAIPCEPTKNWDTWAVDTIDVPLRKGDNIVMLVAGPATGGNVDSLTFVADAAPTPAPTPTPRPPTPTPASNLPQRNFIKGVCAPTEKMKYASLVFSHTSKWTGAISTLQAYSKAGISAGRIWSDFNGWEFKYADFANLQAFANAGWTFGFTLASQNWKKGWPSVASVQANGHSWVASVPSWMKPKIRWIGIGNEPMIGNYAPSHDPQKFVDTFIKPLYPIFHDAGYKVAIAGFNGEFDSDYKRFLDAGATLYHDLVDIHGYSWPVTEYQRKLHLLDTHGKDIVESEWNNADGDKVRANKAFIPDSIKALNQNVQISIADGRIKEKYYFVSDVRDTFTGPKGLFAPHPTIAGTWITTDFYDWQLTF